MQEQIERDLKDALLSGERQKAETLKGLKSALQYEAISSKDSSLSDEQIQKVLARESKKRAEAAELIKKAETKNARRPSWPKKPLSTNTCLNS